VFNCKKSVGIGRTRVNPCSIMSSLAGFLMRLPYYVTF